MARVCNLNLCRLRPEIAIRGKEGRKALRDDELSMDTMKMKMKMNEISKIDKVRIRVRLFPDEGV